MATFMAYRYCEHQFNFQQINGKNKRLIVFGRDQRFANYWKCLDLDDLHNLLSIDREIQAECVNLQRGSVYVPLLGELCMVKSDAMGWLRCSYLGEIGEMSKMYSWDFGVTLNVQKSDIRAMMYGVLKMPIYTLLVKLENANDDDEVNVKNINWVPNSIFHETEN